MVEVMLEALDIRKSFSEPVLNGVSLTLGRDEVLGVVGPNACGKTTLLRILAGLERADHGEVRREGKVALVFQEDRLLPWKTLLENICLGLKYSGIRGDAALERALKYSEKLGLNRSDLGSYPLKVSGGTRRKASIARALALEPEIVLMDEPFTGLDFRTTSVIKSTLNELLRELGSSTIIVSHQLEELLAIADRCLIMTPKPSRIAEEAVLRGLSLEDRLERVKSILLRMIGGSELTGAHGF
ncbi:MAG: ATP-binding cassette domain-containing protein [Candidatus Korarchaeum sp.]